jgi:hypothetical protein
MGHVSTEIARKGNVGKASRERLVGEVSKPLK